MVLHDFSDSRLQKNAEKFSADLSTLNVYKFNVVGLPKKYITLSAQEVLKVIPEIVDSDKNQQYFSIDLNGLTAILVGQINKLNTKVNNISSEISTVYDFKGSVASFSSLPDSADIGDVYNVTDTGMNYAWTGSEWDALSSIVDLTSIIKDSENNTSSTWSSNKINSEINGAIDEIPIDSKMNISGSRGLLAGYSSTQNIASATTITRDSPDGMIVSSDIALTVVDGVAEQAWNKTIGITSAGATVTLGSLWTWENGVQPTITAKGLLILRWCSTFGIASYISGTAAA